jgi:hypothetical protein
MPTTYDTIYRHLYKSRFPKMVLIGDETLKQHYQKNRLMTGYTLPFSPASIRPPSCKIQRIEVPKRNQTVGMKALDKYRWTSLHIPIKRKVSLVIKGHIICRKELSRDDHTSDPSG